MRSAFLIFVLLVVAFVQGVNRIEAHAEAQTRVDIQATLETQRGN